MKNVAFILTVFSFFIFYSCSKSDISNVDKPILTKKEISSIGSEHNRLLIEVLNKFSNNTSQNNSIQNQSLEVKQSYTLELQQANLQNSLNSIFLENGLQELTESEFLVYFHDYSMENIDNTISNNLNGISNLEELAIMNGLINSLKRNVNYNSLLSDLNALKARAENNLTGVSQTATLIAIEVATNSAQLWFPVESGGLGYYTTVLGFKSNNNIQNGSIQSNSVIIKNKSLGTDPRQSAGIIVTADAVGAYSGFLRAALPYFLSGGLANPISNGMLIGTSLIAGVSSSAMAGFSIAVKK
jgi:hypothetical protein